MTPVNPLVQIHVFGPTHVPPFRQAGLHASAQNEIHIHDHGVNINLFVFLLSKYQ